MASVDWQKTNVITLARKRSHFDNEKRAITNHSNEDIDRELTSQNYYLGCNGWADILKKSRDFIAKTDKKHPPKKKQPEEQRITMVSLNIPCPREITDMGKSKEFFDCVNTLLTDLFKGYSGMHVHVDEVHEYMDSKSKIMRTSLIHGHAFVCAYAEWEQKSKKGVEQRKGINGKNFETRENILKLNNAMNEMCKAKFGMPYNTGENEPRKKSVEELKKESYKQLKKENIKQQRKSLQLLNDNENLQAINKDLSEANQKIIEDNTAIQIVLDNTKTEVNMLEEQRNELELEVNYSNRKIKKLEKKQEELKEEIQKKEKEIIEKENIINQKNIEINNIEQNLSDKENELKQKQEVIEQKDKDLKTLQKDFINFKADLKVQFTELLNDFKSAFRQAKTELEKNVLLQKFESKIQQIQKEFEKDFNMETDNNYDFEEWER